MSEVCLGLHGIAKRFGSLSVLEDVTLRVDHGERRGILGPNGAGKSTLFNIIAGELPCSAGRVELLGRDVTRMRSHRRARLGLARTFQTTTLFAKLPVVENVALALQAGSRDRFRFLTPRRRIAARYDEARALLERVGLAARAETRLDDLGYGEKRQVEILLALAQRPKLLLLDEPTAGLAPADTEQITAMLKREARTTTMVVIEHDMTVMFDLVDRLTVLHHGRVVADGPIDTVRSDAYVQDVYLGGKLD